MKYCCETMTSQINWCCEQHSNKYECPDALISYIEKYDEYVLIIHDGGSSLLTITYCPWCGHKLPASKRDLWFSSIEKLGLEPDSKNIPSKFNSSLWYES